MEYRLLLFVSFASLVQCAPKTKTKHLPSYIIPCKVKDPNFSNCTLQHARQALPIVLKGDPSFKLRSSIPFHLEHADLTPNSELKLIIKDGDLHGLETSELVDVIFDLRKRHVKLALRAKLLTVTGTYNVSGQLILLNLRGTGQIKLEFVDTFFKYSFDYDLITKDNEKQYMSIIRPAIEYEIKDAHYQLDNLFDGNKELGDNINKVLNENSKEVLEEFGLVVKEIVKVVVMQPLNAYLTTIPYDELFPQ